MIPTPEVVYVGLLVQRVADAVTAQFPDNAVTVVLREFLDGRSDVTEALPWSRLGDPGLKALPGDIQEFARPRRDVADREREARIADPTAQRGADVYPHDVSISQPPRPRNAVDDLFVDRGTDGAGKGGYRG